MRKNTDKRLSLLAVALSLWLSGMAQTAIIPITYSQYMVKVDSGNLEYAAQKLNVSMARAQIVAAKVRNDPELGFSYFNNEQSKKKMGYGGSVSLAQTFTFGKRTAAIGLAKSEFELSEALLADYLRNLHADAAIAFYESLKRKRLLEIKQETYQHVRALAQSDSIRSVKGEIMGTDAIQSNIEAGVMYNELIQTVAEQNRSCAELALYIGNKKNHCLYHPEAELKLPYREFRLSELIEQSKSLRPDLIAAKQNINVAGRALIVTKREGNTDVTLSLAVGHNAEVKNEIAPAPAFNSITAGVSIPIPFSRLNKGKVHVATQRAQQASLLYEQAALGVQNDIMKAYYQYESTVRQVDHFEKKLLQKAQEVLEGKVCSYRKGEISLRDMMNARRTYNEVRVLYYEAIFNYNTALIELERSAGVWDL